MLMQGCIVDEMKETTTEQRATSRIDYWREQIAQQERSELPVKQFCEMHGITEQMFYLSTKRLRDRIKVLYWDRDGFAIWAKRLEEGTHAIPVAEGPEERRREITAQELGAILSGIDLQRSVRRKRYQRRI